MIRLNVFIEVAPENKEAFLIEAHQLVNLSQKDDGCLGYDIFESSTRKNIFMICETWRDNNALIAHSQSKHFTLYVPKMKSLGHFHQERFESSYEMKPE